ncbi:hypothetical protein [Thermanaerothrix sp.]|uniref:hypothetical protein n=1 Tax=Thermanaerothrix sp. TaxID=2972675 RepID=UPI002ADE5544|nr:hypothetical protein [Thermanaerothrix sp.]
MDEIDLTKEIRFNPYRIRRFGLSSTQEAKVLLYLERQGSTPRKVLSRLFDLRLVERLAEIGLVVCRNGQVEMTPEGRETLQRCMGEDHGRGAA